MRCPYCGHGESQVVDSRDREGGVRRRRKCERCKTKFWTLERVEFPPLVVVKKDGRREPFSREKLLTGIRKACEKRPLGTEAIERLVEDIEAKLHAFGESEVPSQEVGRLVMDGLMGLDEVAYIRFATVYRSLADLASIQAELDRFATNREQGKAGASQLPLPLGGLEADGPEAQQLPRKRGRGK